MKITICAYDAPNNMDGPTVWMKRLLPYLKNNGIEVRIIYIAPRHKNLPAYDHFTKAGFKCRLIYWDLFHEEKIIAIIKDLQENTPDIFIPNYFPFAFIAGRWAKQAGIPTVMILHNDDAFHHKLVDEYAVKNGIYNVSAVVAVSKLITGVVQKNVTNDTVIKYIPYGAPLSKTVTAYTPKKTMGIVYAGRIEERQKRISVVANAFCKVAKEVPGTTCTIYGSGRDEPALKKLLEEKANGLPVKYGGKLDSSKVMQHLLQNHVFVLLSDWEGIPISLMEAMGCGLVPVCYNIRSGITELIDNGINGILIDDRDTAFVQAIKMLKADPDKWQAMSAAARKKIEEEYSEDICNKKWISLFNELIATAAPKKEIAVPSLAEVRSFSLPVEFKEYNNRMPALFLVPFYRFKFFAGRMKRRIFRQLY